MCPRYSLGDVLATLVVAVVMSAALGLATLLMDWLRSLDSWLSVVLFVGIVLATSFLLVRGVKK